MSKYLSKLYSTILYYSATKWAIYLLVIVSFTESFIFFIPPDFLLIPMVLAKPKRAFFYASITGGASVLGGLVGYYIGYYFYEYIGLKIVNLFSYNSQFDYLVTLYDQYSFFAIFIAAFTPIPYKLVTLFSGFVHSNLITFILASILARYGRFLLISCIIYYFKDYGRRLIQNPIISIAIMILLFLIATVYIYYSKS